jgi:signal transduction histidine kinase
MPNYLTFLTGKLAAASNDARQDGLDLARQCHDQLQQVENPEQFPPQLLLLLASPAYADEHSCSLLLAGIHEEFAAHGFPRVPLLGCSVAAVFFDETVAERGALLVCLASRLLTAKLAVGKNARTELEKTTTHLLDSLSLNFTETGNDPNPLVDRMLITFLPGFGHMGSFPAPEIHHLMRRQTRARVPIVGGVSSTGTSHQAGFQFAGERVYQDAVVAAKLTTGFPFSSSIVHGLTTTGKVIRVRETGATPYIISKFEEGEAAPVLGLRGSEDFALCGELSLEREPLVNVLRRIGQTESVRALRKVTPNTCFEVLIPKPERMLKQKLLRMERALQRLKVSNPIGSFGIYCHGRRPVVDHAAQAQATKTLLKHTGAVVGGFFDGEIGQDKHGLSVFGNWCEVDLFFGDEMRQRTPIQRGFQAQAIFAPKLTDAQTLEEAMDHSLELIFGTGFPGAMISLVQEDQAQGRNQSWIVGRRARGARFNKIVEMTKRALDEEDVLAIAARSKTPLFIWDSRQDPRCKQDAVLQSGIISQYILPLTDIHQATFAVLQIDLGDLSQSESGRPDLSAPPYQKTLDLIGSVIEAALMRIINREDIHITRSLDAALRSSLTKPTLPQALDDFIQQAIAAFGADWGHVRLADQKDQLLVMTAGQGDYFETFKIGPRRSIHFSDSSPTSTVFRAEAPGYDPEHIIVNDSQQNEWHQNFIKQSAEQPRALAALRKIKAYANLRIKKQDSGKTVGALSLQAHQAWFFTRARVATLKALGQRIGFIYEHLNRRDTLHQANVNLNFLLRCSDHSPLPATTDPVAVLQEITVRFMQAARADLAALYLWDEETNKYVLRAQEGWADGNWVDVARYAKGERWTGRIAEQNEPQYVPDMYALKQSLGIEQAHNFSLPMFGHALSAQATVEALGLPFESGAGERGVLTLYRRVAAAEQTAERPPLKSGFTTTDPQTLGTAANILAANLSAQLRQLKANWEIAERKRHDKVRAGMEQKQNEFSLDQRLCQKLAETFLAREVNLYLRREPGSSYVWAAGFQRFPKAQWLGYRRADEPVWQAAQTRVMQELRHEIVDSQRADPQLACMEHLIERVCLPLLEPTENAQVFGVLDLRWGVRARKMPSMSRPHNGRFLEKLAKKIAITYREQQQLEQQRQLEEREQRSRLAVEAMGAMVFQTAHRLVNLIVDIRALPGLIRNATTETERLRWLNQLEQLVESAPEKIKRPLDAAHRIRQIELKLHDLHALAVQTVREANLEQLKPGVSVEIEIPYGIYVQIDQELTREAFHNIIKNAVKAMPQNGTLRISAQFSPASRTVDVIFADNGPGMSQSDLAAAKTGFVTTQSSMGLGILVSRLLARAQNGNLEIESQLGSGTKAIFSLSYDPKESEHAYLPSAHRGG